MSEPRRQPRAKLTAEQAGEHMGLTKRQVHELARTQGLPHLRYGPRTVRFELDAIEAWCASRQQGEAA